MTEEGLHDFCAKPSEMALHKSRLAFEGVSKARGASDSIKPGAPSPRIGSQSSRNERQHKAWGASPRIGSQK